MKTIKLLFLSLFMMLGMAAQAQQVVIYKTDGTTETFQASEVDSVVYATKTYKYYLGETDKEVFTEADLTKTTGTKLTSVNAYISTGDTVTNFVYPTSWGKPTKIIHRASQNDYTKAWTYNDDWATVPNGYTHAWIQVAANSIFDITW